MEWSGPLFGEKEMQKIIEKLNETKRTKTEMKKLAEELSNLKVKEYNEIMEKLLEDYNGPALGKLLIVSAINKISVDPVILANSIDIVDHSIDAYFPYKYQDETAIPPLLARSNDMTIDEPFILINPMVVAVELAIKFKAFEKEILDTLKLLSHRFQIAEITENIQDLIKFLKTGKYKDPEVKWKLDLKPLNELPEREITPIYGNNRQKPDETSLGRFVHLDPKVLTCDQLERCFLRALKYNQLGTALAFLLEYWQKSKNEQKFIDHLMTLKYLALFNGNVELNSEINREYFANEEKIPHAETLLQCIDSSEFLSSMEDFCRINILDEKNNTAGSFCLYLQQVFHNYYPALSLLLARSVVTTYPQELENTDLLHNVELDRLRLGLEAKGDPIEDVISAFSDIKELSELEDITSGLHCKVEELNLTVSRYKTDIEKKRKEIDNLEKNVSKLQNQLKGTPEYQEVKKNLQNAKEELEDVKRKLKNCIIMVNEEKEKNQDLRKQIKAGNDIDAQSSKVQKECADIVQPDTINYLVPQYTKTFVDNLSRMGSSIEIKALEAINAFVLRNDSILSKTVNIEALPEHYRIKFSDDYRIMLHWMPGISITILDIINRQDLEKWIHNKQNS